MAKGAGRLSGEEIYCCFAKSVFSKTSFYIHKDVYTQRLGLLSVLVREVSFLFEVGISKAESHV